ncbi:MAG TPA: hypothetical protein VGS58_20715 [Candidatus Sulfopaludibacter sp.]|nr:hypothetical protein [Candidatus Sulfopaludibacter sp.]
MEAAVLQGIIAERRRGIAGSDGRIEPAAGPIRDEQPATEVLESGKRRRLRHPCGSTGASPGGAAFSLPGFCHGLWHGRLVLLIGTGAAQR